jgi:hypothetical protein
VTRPRLLSSLVRDIDLLFLFHTTNNTTEGDKSTTQKLGDSTRSGGDQAQKEGGGILDSASQGLSNAGQAVSDTLSGATGQKK